MHTFGTLGRDRTEWCFVGVARTLSVQTELDSVARSFHDFDRLMVATDAELVSAGLANDEARQSVLTALRAWEEEHNMPGMRATLSMRDGCRHTC